MRKSRSEAAKTRERIVTAAAAEFRQHGIAATGLADLMKAAGLTHGGFYRHFASKDQLVAEACSAAVATMNERVASSASRKRGRKGLEAAVADYLSTEHRDNPRDGCPLAALGSELARADTPARAAATAGFLKLVDALAGGFDEGTPDEARRRAMVVALTLIGALTVSRVVTDQALSDAILRNAEDSITGSQTTGGKKAKRSG
jgi:TetR/AcrR family transcriptional regulator, transcriptional repressor for nem operon